MARPTHAVIDTQALRHNLAHLRSLAPGARIMAVVKADGYGHGLERVARALDDADAFGVAALDDAQRLRAAGLRQRICLLSGFDAPEDIDELRRLEVETVLHHDSQLTILEASQQADWARGADARQLRCWIKLDTGMHRLGFAPERAHEVCRRLARLACVQQPLAWMTHFARSDEFDQPATDDQMMRFASALSGPSGDLDGARSLANSAGILGWPGSRSSGGHENWIRPGGALYGISVVAGHTGADFGLRPAMTLGTRLIAVKRIRQGEPVGYGGEYRAPEDMPIGIAAIGYGDGYPRHAASGTPVLVDGAPACLIGRVSMDLMTIDLRSQPKARVGAPVVLWGEGLPVETVAAAAGTIGYELVCSITRRVRFLER